MVKQLNPNLCAQFTHIQTPKNHKNRKLQPQPTRSSRCHDFREALLTQILQVTSTAVLTSKCVDSRLGVIEGDIRFGVLRVFKTHCRSGLGTDLGFTDQGSCLLDALSDGDLHATRCSYS